MAVRYWHWLVNQKKEEPVQEYYEVSGTALPESNWFDPDYEGENVSSEDNYFDVVVNNE